MEGQGQLWALLLLPASGPPEVRLRQSWVLGLVKSWPVRLM